MRLIGNSHIIPSISLFIIFWTTTPLLAQTGDPWAPLAFLIGDWSGGGSGKSSDAIAGTTRFFMDLEGKIMVRKNRAEPRFRLV